MTYSTKIFTLAVFIIFGIISSLYIQYKAYNLYVHSIQHCKEMRLLSKDIQYLDEVLTMSANMAAFSGDKIWIHRYHEHVVLLDELLEKVKEDAQVYDLILLTDDANKKLVSLELESFKLISQNKIQEAREKLESSEYKANKIDYAKGLQRTIEHIDKKSIQFSNQQRNNFQVTVYIAVVLIILMSLLGIYLVRVLRKYIRELSEKSDLEKQLIERETILVQQSKHALMGEMISMIAHQWRQPLNTIALTSANLQLELMLKNDDANKSFKKKLEDIDLYVNSLTTIIDDFKDFYKPDKKSVSITLEELIGKSLYIIELALKNDNIELLQEYDCKEKVEVYDNEMVQVILNILKNAQDNIVEKGIKEPYIKITTQNKKIQICDNGGGIPEEILENIFDPYFSTKDEKNGTGLGLYMSKTIVEEHHHGKLSVQNTEEGVCFVIELGKATSSLAL